MSDMKSLGPIVRRRRKALGLTLADVADPIGYDAGNLSRFERGGQMIHEELLAKLAAQIKTTVPEILREASESPEEADDIDPKNLRNVNPATGDFANTATGKQTASQHYKGSNAVPVLSESQVLDFLNRHQVKEPPTTYLPELPDSKPTDIAWAVTDDSMTAAPESLASFPRGSYAYIDTAITQHESGDCALIQMGNGSVVFTRLVRAAGTWHMSPLNDRYPAQEMPMTTRVIGIAVGCMSLIKRR